MKKRKSAARGKNAGARRIKVQNRVAMISISMVVCMLVVLLAFKEHSLQVKYQTNENRKAQLPKILKICRNICRATNMRKRLQKRRSVW